MVTSMVAYFVVWMAVGLYVGRLGLRQRQLQWALDELQDRMRHEANPERSSSKAA
jgi:CcmD family protein